jgi:ADP-dependent phosphofructokinase/glucokinase
MDKSVKQLEDVRMAIQVNIESIKSLLEQANSLSELIAPIEDTILRDKLEENLKGIYSTIDTLIENTDKLFDELKEFAATTVH